MPNSLLRWLVLSMLASFKIDCSHVWFTKCVRLWILFPQYDVMLFSPPTLANEFDYAFTQRHSQFSALKCALSKHYTANAMSKQIIESVSQNESLMLAVTMADGTNCVFH